MIISLHETVHNLLWDSTNILQDLHSPVADSVSDITTEWRAAGVNIMRLYRVIEGLLNISRSDSRFPALASEPIGDWE